MVTHSSVLAWQIPWTEEPGGLPSVGSHRVGHDWSDLAAKESVRSFFASWCFVLNSVPSFRYSILLTVILSLSLLPLKVILVQSVYRYMVNCYFP